MKHAVIYCRVSSDKQATEGHGLTSQESSCRKYAAENGFEVLRVFRDDYTGGGDFWRRPGLQALLAFLEDQDEKTAVIFDDLKRFARDTRFHLQLRQELSARNAFPRCPNFRFDETPEGEFVETVIAATAELERKQNRRQVISRMKARLEAGHWVFSPPLGYRFETIRGERRVVPDPATADCVRDALVDFSTGKLATQSQVVDYLRSSGCAKRSGLSKQAIRRFLGNEFYAGWCICQKWEIRSRGVHKALITEEQHRHILERLRPPARIPLRTEVREDFPLRGFVHCQSCGRQLTAGWTQGRNERYPYYRCQNRGCIGGVAKRRLEDLFVERLQEAQPTDGALRLFERTLTDVAGNRERIAKQHQQSMAQREEEIDREIESYVTLLHRSSSPTVQPIYEQKIEDLEKERTELKAPLCTSLLDNFAPVLKEGRRFLKDPSGSWLEGNLRRRRTVQNLVFSAPIPYSPESGLCTARFSLLYRLLGKSVRGESGLVELLQQNLHPVAEELIRWRSVLGDDGLVSE